MRLYVRSFSWLALLFGSGIFFGTAGTASAQFMLLIEVYNTNTSSVVAGTQVIVTPTNYMSIPGATYMTGPTMQGFSYTNMNYDGGLFTIFYSTGTSNSLTQLVPAKLDSGIDVVSNGTGSTAGLEVLISVTDNEFKVPTGSSLPVTSTATGTSGSTASSMTFQSFVSAPNDTTLWGVTAASGVAATYGSPFTVDANATSPGLIGPLFDGFSNTTSTSTVPSITPGSPYTITQLTVLAGISTISSSLDNYTLVSADPPSRDPRAFELCVAGQRVRIIAWGRFCCSTNEVVEKICHLQSWCRMLTLYLEP